MEWVLVRAGVDDGQAATARHSGNVVKTAQFTVPHRWPQPARPLPVFLADPGAKFD